MQQIQQTSVPGGTCPVSHKQPLQLTAPNTPLQRIIRFLAETITPERIFLLSEEPFDLLVVLPDQAEKPYSFYETMIEMACMDTVIHFSLHKSSDLARQLAAGHIFYATACTPGRLVYENGKTAFPITPPGKTEVLHRQAVERFTPGYRRAGMFFETAQEYCRKGASDMAAFMLHQAAELTFRAVVLGLMDHDTRSHDFAALKNYCRRCVPVLNHIVPDELLPTLGKAYLAARYGSFEIEDRVLETLLQKVAQLHHRAQQEFDRCLSVIAPMAVAA